MFTIQDWAGNEIYPGETFDTVEDAVDFLTANQRKQHPNATDDEFDEIMGEFFYIGKDGEIFTSKGELDGSN